MTSKIKKLFVTGTKKREPLAGGAPNVKLGKEYDGQTNTRLVSIGDDPYVFGTEKMKKILAKKVDSGKVDQLNKTRTRIFDDDNCQDVSRSNFGGDICKSPTPKKNILTDEFMDRQNLWLKKKKTREHQPKPVTRVNLSKTGKVITAGTSRAAKSPSITTSKALDTLAFTAGKNRTASVKPGRGSMTPAPKRNTMTPMPRINIMTPKSKRSIMTPPPQGSAPLKKKQKKSFGEGSGLTNLFQHSRTGSYGSEADMQMLGLIGGIDGGNQIIQGM
jgi:hypothetical protein